MLLKIGVSLYVSCAMVMVLTFLPEQIWAQEQYEQGEFLSRSSGAQTWKSDLVKEEEKKSWQANVNKTAPSQNNRNVPMSGSWTAKSLNEKSDSAEKNKTVMGRTTATSKKKDINAVVEEAAQEEESKSFFRQSYSFNN